MRDMAHFIGLFTLVIACGSGIIWGMDGLLGIHHTDAHGAAASSLLVIFHHVPYFLLGGGLMALHRHIFGR